MSREIIIERRVKGVVVAPTGKQGPPGPANGTTGIVCPDDNTTHNIKVRKLPNGDYQVYPEKVT